MTSEQGEMIELSPPREGCPRCAAGSSGTGSGDAEPRCYVCMETAGARRNGPGGEVRLLAVCRCSASGAMPICKECFLTWLERELERQGERAASPGWSVSCNVCKEPYRLRRARKPARVLCYTLGERLFTGLFFASFLVGCLVVGYIMVSLTALLSGNDAAYDVLVGGDESIFRAAEITLLFAFVVGSSAIVLTFLWHSFSPCSAPLPEQRDVATLFDLKALDRLTVDYGARSSPWWLRGGLGRAAAAAPARKFGARWSRSAEVQPAADGAGPALAEGGEPGTAAHQVPRGPHAMQWGFVRERAPAPPPV